MDEHLNLVLLLSFVVLLVAVLAVRVADRTGLPSLLVYLALGLVVGEAGLGVRFDDYRLTADLGLVALAVILAEGGLTTRWSAVRPSLPFAAVLATVGVAVSVLVVAGVAHTALGLDWQTSVVLGGVLASTDAAAVFSVLRKVPLPSRLTGQLEVESGLNDAPTVLLVVLASEGTMFEHPPWQVAGIIGYELVAGVLVGLALGRLGAWAMVRAALPSSGLYPLSVLTLCVLAYSVAAAPLHASGFAAVYVCALVLGNSDLPHRTATRSFIEGLGWLSQIGLFVMLGLLITPSEVTARSIVIAVVAGAALSLVARPLSVVASLAWLRVPAREIAFVSWAGLRGAVPVVLATIPLSEGVEGARTLFDVVFVLVVIDTLLTAPTLPWLASRLGLLQDTSLRDLEIEAAPLERVAADLLQVRITRRSRMHGVEVGELRMPPGASVALVVRDGATSVPGERTVLRAGDELLVVTPRNHRAATEQRLRAVSERGRLATWLE